MPSSNSVLLAAYIQAPKDEIQIADWIREAKKKHAAQLAEPAEPLVHG